MVRLKTRWLLVRLEFFSCGQQKNGNGGENVTSRGRSGDWDGGGGGGAIPIPPQIGSGKRLAAALRDHLLQTMGVAFAGAAAETQGKLAIVTS